MSDFCPNCFVGTYSSTCKQCGYTAVQQSPMMLQPGTVLKGRYKLGRALGAGGFGITYLAQDAAGAKVAIKEYLPTVLAVRDPQTNAVRPSSRDNQQTFDHGLRVFNRESQTLRRFAGNRAIVQVHDAFEENGTAYFAMEYLDGVNLKALARSMGGAVPLEFALEILRSAAAALAAVHAQGLLHRDVSPENVFITKAGDIKLIDFGATRFFVGEKSRSLSVILKPGFAPPEQYSSKGNQGPWTDVYALCATVYSVLSGQRVPDAPDRLAGAALPPLQGISQALCLAIECGLALDYRARYQDMQSFIAALPAENNLASQPPAVQPSPPIQPVQQAYYDVKGHEVQGTPYLQKGQADKWALPKNLDMHIGRSSETCNIVLDEPNISRVHCAIRYDDKSGMFYLMDMSSNGTFIDGKRMEKGKAYALLPNKSFTILPNGITMKVGLE